MKRLLSLFVLLSGVVAAQSVHLTVPAVDSAGGAVAIGTAYISWGQFKDNSGIIVQSGSITRLVTAGVIDVTLTASDSAGYVYTVLLMKGSAANTFKWRVPAGGASSMAQLNEPAAGAFHVLCGGAECLNVDAANSRLVVGDTVVPSFVTIGKACFGNFGVVWLNQAAPGSANFALAGSLLDLYVNAPPAGTLHFGVGNAGDIVSVDRLGLLLAPRAADPGCTANGRLWNSSADAANSHVKVCVLVASALAWVDLF